MDPDLRLYIISCIITTDHGQSHRNLVAIATSPGVALDWALAEVRRRDDPHQIAHTVQEIPAIWVTEEYGAVRLGLSAATEEDLQPLRAEFRAKYNEG